MEDPGDAFKTVSARNYNRNLTKKLYEISNNVGEQQLQNIVADNIKIENEMNLNAPSSSSSSFSDMSSFKKEDDELSMAGYGSDSETETDETTGGGSESDILPEVPFQAVQDNNSGHAQPIDFIPHQSDESLARQIDDKRNSKDVVLNRFK
jgi:hypothetical protein